MELMENAAESIQNEAANLLDKVVKPLESIQIQVEEKLHLVMSIIRLTNNYNSSLINSKDEDKRNLQFENKIKHIQNEMQKMQNEEETVMANVEKIEQFNDSLLERVELMYTVLNSQTRQKFENSRKMAANLSRKAKQLLASKGDVLTAHESQMAAKHSELESINAKITYLGQEREDSLSKINSVFKETDIERHQLEEVNSKLREVESIRQQMESSERVVAHLASEIEAKVEAENKLQVIAQTVGNQINSLEQTFDMAKEDLLSAMEHQSGLEIRLQAMTHLMDLVRRNDTFSAFERDEVFQREVVASDYFNQLKSYVEQKQLDNMNINNDVEGKYCEVEAQDPLISSLRGQLEEIEDDLRELQGTVDEADQSIESTRKKLQTQQQEHQKTIEALEKEITELKADSTNAQEDLVRSRKVNEGEITKLNLKLKVEQSKTLRAKELQQPAIKIVQTFTQESGSQQIFLSKGMSSSTTLKRRYPEVPNLSQQPSSSSANQHPTSENVSVEPRSSPKKLKVSNESFVPGKLSLKSKHPMPISSSFPVAKPKVPVAKLKSPVVEVSVTTPKFDRLMKENLPVPYKDSLVSKPLSAKNATFDKPAYFDSDGDSSFDITFNTDVEEFLE